MTLTLWLCAVAASILVGGVVTYLVFRGAYKLGLKHGADDAMYIFKDYIKRLPRA